MRTGETSKPNVKNLFEDLLRMADYDSLGCENIVNDQDGFAELVQMGQELKNYLYPALDAPKPKQLDFLELLGKIATIASNIQGPKTFEFLQKALPVLQRYQEFPLYTSKGYFMQKAIDAKMGSFNSTLEKNIQSVEKQFTSQIEQAKQQKLQLQAQQLSQSASAQSAGTTATQNFEQDVAMDIDNSPSLASQSQAQKTSITYDPALVVYEIHSSISLTQRQQEILSEDKNLSQTLDTMITAEDKPEKEHEFRAAVTFLFHHHLALATEQEKKEQAQVQEQSQEQVQVQDQQPFVNWTEKLYTEICKYIYENPEQTFETDHCKVYQLYEFVNNKVIPLDLPSDDKIAMIVHKMWKLFPGADANLLEAAILGQPDYSKVEGILKVMFYKGSPLCAAQEAQSADIAIPRNIKLVAKFAKKETHSEEFLAFYNSIAFSEDLQEYTPFSSVVETDVSKFQNTLSPNVSKSIREDLSPCAVKAAGEVLKKSKELKFKILHIGKMLLTSIRDGVLPGFILQYLERHQELAAVYKQNATQPNLEQDSSPVIVDKKTEKAQMRGEFYAPFSRKREHAAIEDESEVGDDSGQSNKDFRR